MKLKNRKGQSVLEWTLLVAAVLGAVIAVAAAYRSKTQAGYSNATDIIDQSMTNLKNSITPSSTSTAGTGG